MSGTMDKLTDGARKLGIELTLAQLQQFEQYYALLVEWNARMNLTAILEYDKVQLLHFLDSLSVVLGLENRNLLEKPGLKVLDVGTGAGFPGIPMKIVFPAIDLCLNDATEKKSLFLAEVVRKLGLKSVQIAVGRAEELGQMKQHRERFDLILCRAVAEMAALAELCLPFCCPGGRVIAQKKGGISDEMERARRAVKEMGGAPVKTVKVDLPELGDGRCLVVVEKVGKTPPQYPRRPGMPANKPIL